MDLLLSLPLQILLVVVVVVLLLAVVVVVLVVVLLLRSLVVVAMRVLVSRTSIAVLRVRFVQCVKVLWKASRMFARCRVATCCMTSVRKSGELKTLAIVLKTVICD